jgi:hypothetical protein
VRELAGLVGRREALVLGLLHAVPLTVYTA